MPSVDTPYERIVSGFQFGATPISVSPGLTQPGVTVNVVSLLGISGRSALVQAITWAPAGDAPSAAPTIIVNWTSAGGVTHYYNASTSSTSGNSLWFYLPPTAVSVQISVTNNDTESNAITVVAELQALVSRGD